MPYGILVTHQDICISINVQQLLLDISAASTLIPEWLCLSVAVYYIRVGYLVVPGSLSSQYAYSRMVMPLCGSLLYTCRIPCSSWIIVQINQKNKPIEKSCII